MSGPELKPRISRRLVTILVVDLVESTALADRLDPELIASIQDGYYERCRRTVERHGGTIEKYIGDAVVAVFGSPVAHEDDPLRAARTAVEIRSELQRFSHELVGLGIRLGARFGIQTGDVLARDRSDGQAFVAGDAINVASRLEHAADPDEIVVGATAAQLLAASVEFSPREPVIAKGKPVPVAAVRLVALRPKGEAITRRHDLPLVGRADELRVLGSAFEAVVGTSAASFVLVVGEAGIGKSRLIREFTERLPRASTLLTSRCLPYGEGITYWPAAEVVRAGTGIESGAGRDAIKSGLVEFFAGEGHAQALVHALAVILGLAEGATAEDLAWGFRRFLERRSARGALVVVVDDVQWAEPALLDLFDRAVAGMNRGKVLFVTVARPDVVDRHSDWYAARPPGSVIRLGPLTTAETEHLFRQATGELDEGARHRAARTVALSGGNPLFLEQLAAVLGSRSGVDDEDGQAVPMTLNGLIGARIDSLAAEDRQILEAAATIGETFALAPLEPLCPDRSMPDIEMALATLERRDLLAPSTNPELGGIGYGFRHLLVRDAAYGRIPKRDRVRLHAAFVEWLDRYAVDRREEFDEIAGYHLERAYRSGVEIGMKAPALGEQAAQRLESASSRALRRQDLPAAGKLAERAAGLLSDPGRKLELTLLQAEARVDQGDREAARKALDAARTLGLELGDTEATTRVDVLDLRDRYHAGELKLGSELEGRVEQLARHLEAIGDTAGAARALIVLYEYFWYAARLERFDEVARRALSAATAAGDTYLVDRIQADLLAMAYSGPTPVDEAFELSKAMRASGIQGLIGLEAVARLDGLLYAMRGDFDRARRSGAESARLADELGSADLKNRSARARGMVEDLAGDPVAAERCYREALEHTGFEGHMELERLANALCDQGRFDEARVAAAEAASAIEGDREPRPLGAMATARVRAHDGAVGEAIATALGAVRSARGIGFINEVTQTAILGGRLMRDCGAPAEARSLAIEALDLAERKGNLVAARAARDILATVESTEAKGGKDRPAAGAHVPVNGNQSSRARAGPQVH